MIIINCWCIYLLFFIAPAQLFSKIRSLLTETRTQASAMPGYSVYVLGQIHRLGF
jgi:hypothetical protein